MKKVWVVASNGSSSKVYHAETNEKLVELRHFEHEESRLPTRELISDSSPGNQTQRAYQAQYASHSKTPARLKEKDHFAEEIALFLEESLNKGQFEKLYLIASHQFLSLLHHHLTPNVKKIIASEVSKDLTKHSSNEVRGVLPPTL